MRKKETPEYNCLIQFDGVHWHKLDKPINFESISKHEKTIEKKFLKDRIFDKYIIETSMRLIRITDLFYKKDKIKAVNNILNMLYNKWTGVKYLGSHYQLIGLS